MTEKKKRSPAAGVLSVLSVLLAAAACVLLVLILRGRSGARSYEECLELGQKYLEEMNYDEAILMFQDAVNIEPKRTEAYTELVNLYIAQGEYDKAREVLDYAEKKVDEEGREKLSVQRTKIDNAEYLAKEKTPTPTPVPEDTTDEDLLNYLEKTLYPQKGHITDLHFTFGYVKASGWDGMMWEEYRGETGILHHRLHDMDGDGKNELIVITRDYISQSENSYTWKYWSYNFEIFKVRDGSVTSCGGGVLDSSTIQADDSYLRIFLKDTPEGPMLCGTSVSDTYLLGAEGGICFEFEAYRLSGGKVVQISSVTDGGTDFDPARLEEDRQGYAKAGIEKVPSLDWGGTEAFTVAESEPGTENILRLITDNNVPDGVYQYTPGTSVDGTYELF